MKKQELLCPKIIVQCLITDSKERVLLTRYPDRDGQAGYFVPNDLLSANEDPEILCRKLALAFGAKVQTLKMIDTESFSGQDQTWHLVLNYQAQVIDEKNDIKAEAQWFELKDLPPVQEFAHHGWGYDLIERALKLKERFKPSHLSHLYFEYKNINMGLEFWEALGLQRDFVDLESDHPIALLKAGELTVCLASNKGALDQQIYLGVKDLYAFEKTLDVQKVSITMKAQASHWDTHIMSVKDPEGRSICFEM